MIDVCYHLLPRKRRTAAAHEYLVHNCEHVCTENVRGKIQRPVLQIVHQPSERERARERERERERDLRDSCSEISKSCSDRETTEKKKEITESLNRQFITGLRNTHSKKCAVTSKLCFLH